MAGDRSATPPGPTTPRDGRVHTPRIVARLEPLEGGRAALRSPGVGRLRQVPVPGDLVVPGTVVGLLETLGVLAEVVAPAGARGLVVPDDAPRGGPAASARRPVAFDAPFLVLDPEAAGTVATGAETSEAEIAAGAGLAFRAPTSGRFYARPSPDEPPYVSTGDTVQTGQTIGLLEVMKTFSRVTYGGPGLPDTAKVVRVVPADESDLEQGAVILELEPA